MSGIGDYIHARWENYQRYGLGAGTPGDKNASMALYRARQNIKAMSAATKTNLNTVALEEYLSGFMHTKQYGTGNTNLTPEEISQHQKYFSQLVQSKIPTLAASLDLQSGTNIDFYTKAKGINLKQTGVREKTRAEVQMTIQALLYEIDSAINSGNGNIKQLNALKARGDKLVKRLELLRKESASQLVSFNTVIRTGETAKDIFAEYNSYIKSLRQPTMKDYGDLAELYFAYALSAVTGVAKSGIKDLMDGFVVGGSQVDTVGFQNLSSFINTEVMIEDLSGIQNFDNQSKGSRWQANANGYTVNLTQKGSRSQQTVDIAIDFQGDYNSIQKFGTNNFNASVKNSGNISNIKILDKYPLSAAFALFDSTFVNHYLNLISTHTDGGKGDATHMSKAIEYGVALRALSGARDMNNSMGLSLSNCLIINDRKSHRVRVFTTDRIMRNIANNLEKHIHTHGMPTSISQSWVGRSNSWEKASQRIAHLLAATHQFKLTMSLKNVSNMQLL